MTQSGRDLARLDKMRRRSFEESAAGCGVGTGERLRRRGYPKEDSKKILRVFRDSTHLEFIRAKRMVKPQLSERLLDTLEACWSFQIAWSSAGGDQTPSQPRRSSGSSPEGPLVCTQGEYLQQVHPEDRAKFLERVEQLTPDANASEVVYRIVLADRQVICKTVMEGRFEEGKLVAVNGIYADQTAPAPKPHAESHAGEYKVRQFIETIPGIVWTANNEGRIEYVNARWHEYTGRDSEQLSPAHWNNLVHPDDLDECREQWCESIRTGSAYKVECRFLGRNKQYKWFLINATPMYAENGAIECWIGVCTDIHDRKEIEVNLAAAVAKRTQEVRDALAEKTVLLKEVHHRVKNNLAVISSLLGIKANSPIAPEAQSALRDSQQRLLSIALVHEQLYNSNHLDYINFADYAKQLANSLYATIAPDRIRIKLELAVEPLTLGIHRAVPCGLILNELVTNSFKYAFPNDAEGVVRISFRMDTPGNIVFTVSDNGIGLPATVEGEKSKAATGLRVVRVLAKQLDGTFHLRSDHGTVGELRFPQGSGRLVE